MEPCHLCEDRMFDFVLGVCSSESSYSRSAIFFVEARLQKGLSQLFI